jgi:hypothetical protein
MPIPDEVKLPSRTPLKQETRMAKKSRDTITDILDMPSSSIERPKPIPQGTYVSQVIGQFREDKSTKKGTRYHEYTLKLVKPATNGEGEPLDVDMDALEQSLTKASGEVQELSDRTLRHTIYITPDAMWRYKDFLDHLGIPQEEDGEELSTLQRAGMAPGRFVLVHIKHTPSQDGMSTFANIDKTAPYDQE